MFHYISVCATKKNKRSEYSDIKLHIVLLLTFVA